MINFLETILKKNSAGKIDGNNIKKFHAEYIELQTMFPLLSEKNTSLSRYEWHLLNDKQNIPSCMFCNNDAVWVSRKKSYSKYCSTKCANKDHTVIEKRERTNIEKYGAKYKLISDEGKNESRNTNIEKYGVEFPAQNPEIYAKVKQTNIEKYNSEYVITSKHGLEKTKRTNIEKYGVDNVQKLSSIRNKSIETKIKKYGTSNNIAKAKKTNLRKYGAEHYSQAHINANTMQLLNDPTWLLHQHKKLNKSLTEIANELLVSVSHVSEAYKYAGIAVVRHGTSIPEKELVSLLVENGLQVIHNSKDIIPPNEVDIFIKDKNIAIEYNGVYWHSELKGKNKTYHLNKTIALQEMGVQLIHIFSSEWEEKKEIVKSRILNLIGKSKKIYARKCEVKILDSMTKKEFMVNNHIQGDCASRYNIGLYHDEELVAAMSFGTPRFNKAAEIELLRYATKSFTTVIGGPSKLFKYFINNTSYNTIISYADRRWSTGKLYEMLGFNKTHDSAPNFYHFHTSKPNKLYSRLSFQKHKLKDKLQIYDPMKTAWQNMAANGFDRIWDCGNSVWMYTRN